MTDYRTLSPAEKKRVDQMILDTVPYALHVNKANGFRWVEPEYTLKQVHSGRYCAECLNVYYNCLCSHS